MQQTPDYPLKFISGLTPLETLFLFPDQCPSTKKNTAGLSPVVLHRLFCLLPWQLLFLGIFHSALASLIQRTDKILPFARNFDNLQSALLLSCALLTSFCLSGCFINYSVSVPTLSYLVFTANLQYNPDWWDVSLFIYQGRRVGKRKARWKKEDS